MNEELEEAIRLAERRARETGEAHVVIEDAEEPDYYMVFPITVNVSVLGVVVHIARPKETHDRR